MTTTIATIATIPDAAAVLVEVPAPRGRVEYDWMIPKCPYCGKKHWHGAGDDINEVHRFLGDRVAHCTGAGLKQYRLVRDGGEVRRHA
jgi:hypothetical protein